MQNIIVFIVVAFALICALVALFKRLKAIDKGKGGCSDNCSACNKKCNDR